jgi:hypothetical protein
MGLPGDDPLVVGRLGACFFAAGAGALTGSLQIVLVSRYADSISGKAEENAPLGAICL